MSEHWFRMYDEFAFDPKVQAMPEVMQRRLVMLFCLQSRGDLDQLSDDEICYALRLDNETLHETLQLFQTKGFIDENRQVLNWSKRQYKSDTSTNRVRKHRAAKKVQQSQSADNSASAGHETSNETKGNVSVTPPDSDTDSEKEKNTKKETLLFDEFFEQFPPQRRGNPDVAKLAYQRVLDEGRASEDEIMQGVQSYKGSDEVAKGFAKTPANWLNNNGWANHYRSPKVDKAEKQSASEKIQIEFDHEWQHKVYQAGIGWNTLVRGHRLDFAEALKPVVWQETKDKTALLQVPKASMGHLDRIEAGLKDAYGIWNTKVVA